MTIAEQVTQLKTDFDLVKQAGYAEGYEVGKSEGGDTDAAYQQGVTDGEKYALEKIDSLYYFFADGQRMGIYETLMNSDLSRIKNVQYLFNGNTKLTEFEMPETLNPTHVHYMFQNCTSVTRINLFGKSAGSVLTGVFSGCTALVDVGTVNFQGVGYANRTFLNCTSLQEIRISGEIGLSVSFGDSPNLSADSIQSIIDHLADRTGTTALSLTLHTTVVGKMTDSQKADIKDKNWDLVS